MAICGDIPTHSDPAGSPAGRTAPLTFYDTHAHLDFPEFAGDLPQVIERARAAGIGRIITIGTDLNRSRRAIELSERFASVFAVVGWHPSYVADAPADIRAELRDLARHPKVVALGETGLDYHRLPSGKPGGTAEDDALYKRRQAALFQQHLEVAAELGLNVVVHQRDAFDDTVAQMQPFVGRVRGVFHCFANDTAALQRVLAMNGLVSFTGVVTFKNAHQVRKTLAATPLDRFMLETDCPFLAPAPHRGTRCEPAFVKDIADAVARVHGCSLHELSRVTCQTAGSFFRGLHES